MTRKGDNKMNPELLGLLEQYYKQSEFNHVAFEYAATRHYYNAQWLKWGSILLMGLSISMNIFDVTILPNLNNSIGALGLMLELIDKDSTSAKKAVKCGEKAGNYLKLRDSINILLYQYRGKALSEVESWSEGVNLIKKYEEISAKGPQTNRRDYEKAEKYFSKENGK